MYWGNRFLSFAGNTLVSRPSPVHTYSLNYVLNHGISFAARIIFSVRHHVQTAKSILDPHSLLSRWKRGALCVGMKVIET